MICDKKARITRIGTIEGDVVTDWGFAFSGGKGDDLTRTDGQQGYVCGWTLSELKEISQAAQNCPLYRLGVLLR